MKKIILLILIFFSFQTYSQNWQRHFNQYQNQNIQNAKNSANAAAANARRAANAARSLAHSEAMKNNNTKVLKDLLVDNSKNYKIVVIDTITGWKIKANLKTILSLNKKTTNMNIIYTSRDNVWKRFHSHSYSENESNNKLIFGEVYGKQTGRIGSFEVSSDSVLFLTYDRNALNNYDRETRIKLYNFQNVLIYEAEHFNIPFEKMFAPILKEYVFSKEMAIKQLKESKEYLELGIISQKEYDAKVKKLRPIVLEK